MRTRFSERIAEEDMHLEPIQPPQSPTKASRKQKSRSDKSPSKKRRRQDKENDGSQTPRAKTPRADIDRYSHYDDNTFNHSEQFREGSMAHRATDQHRPSDFMANFEDDDYHDQFEQPMSVGPVSCLACAISVRINSLCSHQSCQNEEMLEDETAEQFEERVRNKRTNVLLRFIAPQLEEGDVTFSHLVKSNRRKQVICNVRSLTCATPTSQ